MLVYVAICLATLLFLYIYLLLSYICLLSILIEQTELERQRYQQLFHGVFSCTVKL